MPVGLISPGAELEKGKIIVVRQLPSNGNFSEIYVVRKKQGPDERLLKINLPHDKIDEKAPKIVHDFSKEDPRIRTQREAGILGLFNHPNIARVDECIDIKTDHEILSGILFQPLPGGNGKTLREHIDIEKMDEQTSWWNRCRVFPDLTTALLQALLALRIVKRLDPSGKTYIVHRDIRPRNIVMDGYGQPYLIDFGLACKSSEAGTWPSRTYAPPEIHFRPGDSDSDCWHLGLTLYEYLTGEHLIDNSPDPEERKKRIIEKTRSLYVKENAIRFYEDLIQKFSTLEDRIQKTPNIKLGECLTALLMTAYLCQPSDIPPPWRPLGEKIIYAFTIQYEGSVTKEIERNLKNLKLIKYQ